MGNEKRLGIDHIYIIHALKGYEVHEKRLRDILGGRYSMDFELVTDGDPSMWTDELLNKYFTPDIKTRLSTGILSCTLNHILSYEKILSNADGMALIFENDPFFSKDFPEKLAAIVNQARELKKGFLISLENTALEFPPKKSIQRGKLLYPATHGRCAGAYLIDCKAAADILNDLKTNKCSQVIDWWHNELISKGVVSMYWAHPPIIEQGSHNGKMKSPIATRAKSISRRLKWITQKYYKTYILRHFK